MEAAICFLMATINVVWAVAIPMLITSNPYIAWTLAAVNGGAAVVCFCIGLAVLRIYR